jgi:hypothetical protein
MTNLTAPPKVARWLLNHFGCSPNNEAVIGDLDERYCEGRSAAWYWVQALVALAVGFFREVRMHKALTVKAIIKGWLVVTLTSFFIGIVCWLYFFAAMNFGDRAEAGAFVSQLQTAPLIRWVTFAWGIWCFMLAGFLLGRRKGQHRTLALLCFGATFPLAFAFPLDHHWQSEIGTSFVALLFTFLGGGLLTNSGRRERSQ